MTTGQATHGRLATPRDPKPRPTETQRCRQCRATKPVGQFTPNTRAKSGYSHVCVECRPPLPYGPRPGHRLSDLNVEQRSATCGVCGVTQVWRNKDRWRCAGRGSEHNAEGYARRTDHVINKGHGQQTWHRIRGVRGDEMRGTCTQCGDVPVRYDKARDRYWCHSATRLAAYAARERRRRHLKQYGLTPEQYDQMSAAQGGACAICGETREGDPRSRAAGGLVVDHCHSTGAVRALLCSNCNVGLGAFGDSAARLGAAIDYLALYAPR